MLFRQLTVFLNFNLFATIGSWIASYIQWVRFSYIFLFIIFYSLRQNP